MKCPKCQAENPETKQFCGDCGTQLTSQAEARPSFTKTIETPQEELATGSVFANRYQVIEELGKGGMGKVYRVLDKKLHEEVALKLIKPEIASDKKTLERFKNELKLARRVSQKNIGRMFDLGEEKGTHYITMEYVPGEDLKSSIKRFGQLPIVKSISIAKQLCEGLSEAHGIGIVHRDLKPSNVMIDKEGNARIMDFGIARSLESKGITGTGIMIGTPEYMSPEQVEGKDVDQRSDIYSLGVVLYEMMTGQLPFEGNTPLSIALKHKSETPREPNKLNIQISRELNYAIKKCIEKDRERRYQRAEELLADLNLIEKSISSTERHSVERELKAVKIDKAKRKNRILYRSAYVILILIIAFGFYIFNRSSETINSIAVLPFGNENPDTEYLSDGIAESLTNKLSQVPGMKKVIARGSVSRYKGKEIDPQETGKVLDVDAVLIGQMSQRGDDLSISVELMRVRDSSHIWGNRYRQKISEIFAIQEDISNSIVDGLRLSLTEKELQTLTKRHTLNTDAYQTYLKGRYYWNKRTEKGFQQGIEYFKQAIDTDPTYALAYAGLADCYSFLGWHDFLPSGEVYPKARAAAEKALEIDEGLSEAHTSLAFVKYIYDWNWKDAEKEFRRAIEINPSYSTAHQWYAQYLSNRNRQDEAITEAKRAQELDPLSLSILHTMGLIFYQARNYDQAVVQFKKILEMDSTYVAAHWFLAYPYVQMAMYSEAISEVQTAIDLTGKRDPALIAWLGIAYSYSGERDKAERVIEELLELSKQRYVAPCYIVFIYIGLGQKELAFDWLGKAYEVRDDWFVGLKTSPLFDGLRSDPRFDVLLKRIGSD